jgi:hypothetical protein
MNTESQQQITTHNWPDVIGSGGNAPSERGEQQEWFVIARTNVCDLYIGDSSYRFDQSHLPIIQAICDAHNAALTAERRRREHAEFNKDGYKLANLEMANALLSALAAINFALGWGDLPLGVEEKLRHADLSLLHEHDAEVIRAENKRMMEFWQGEREIEERKRKPLVDALGDIASGVPDRSQMIKVALDALAKVEQ